MLSLQCVLRISYGNAKNPSDEPRFSMLGSLPEASTNIFLSVSRTDIGKTLMPITSQQLEALIQEVEKEDPIDFADLPFAEDELRALVANRLCEMSEAMVDFSDEDRHLSLLAVAAKLLLENLVLHVQLLRRDGLPLDESGEELLRRLRDER
jgi:hypothetical protein